jgi:tRNA nucleotidyltransferase/poly(A) polymerase
MTRILNIFMESRVFTEEIDKNDFHSKLVLLAKQWKGKVYLVGGAVRDKLLGHTPKDLDYVVTKIDLASLSNKLKQMFPDAKVSEVGESFGIVKLAIGTEEFDFAIPRADVDRENVKVDPNIPIEQDLLRRDFTCNSLAQDLESGKIISPEGFDGISDIKSKILRATGNPVERFTEDPLRILRGLQQSARFGFNIEENTLKAMAELRNTLHSVSSERFYEEFKKAWTKGNADVFTFFDLLGKTGIGKEIFGEDFNPIPIKIHPPEKEEVFLGQYMAAFYNGGKYQLLSKKVNEQQWIESIRTVKDLAHGKIDIIAASKKLGKHFSSHGFGLLLLVLKNIDIETFDKFNKVLKAPFITRVQPDNHGDFQLPLSGEEIINLYKSLGIELKGKQIQDAIYNLIINYQNGTIKLDFDKQTNIERISDYIRNTHGK